MEALLKRNTKMRAEVERKELQNVTAVSLSSDPNEAVQKSLAKSSEDEERPRPSAKSTRRQKISAKFAVIPVFKKQRKK